jgi:hypothetical protein
MRVVCAHKGEHTQGRHTGTCKGTHTRARASVALDVARASRQAQSTRACEHARRVPSGAVAPAALQPSHKPRAPPNSLSPVLHMLPQQPGVLFVHAHGVRQLRVAGARGGGGACLWRVGECVTVVCVCVFVCVARRNDRHQTQGARSTHTHTRTHTHAQTSKHTHRDGLPRAVYECGIEVVNVPQAVTAQRQRQAAVAQACARSNNGQTTVKPRSNPQRRHTRQAMPACGLQACLASPAAACVEHVRHTGSLRETAGARRLHPRLAHHSPQRQRHTCAGTRHCCVVRGRGWLRRGVDAAAPAPASRQAAQPSEQHGSWRGGAAAD